MINKKSQPIFIIGISRSGSKFYQQLLNSNDEICIAPEMNFFFPFKKDVRDIIIKNIHNGPKQTINEIYNSKLKNTFTNIISNFTKEELAIQIQKNGKFNLDNIFKSILELYCLAKGKKIYGAKFPIHNSKLFFLNNIFPSAKIIFIYRNPIDIANSDLVKKIYRIKNKKSSFITNNLFILKLIFPFYIAYEWSQLLKNYERYVKKFGTENSLLLNYEMIKTDPDKIVYKIAKLLHLSPNDFNLNEIQKIDSSRKNSLFDSIPKHQRLYSNFIIKMILFKKIKKYNF